MTIMSQCRELVVYAIAQFFRYDMDMLTLKTVERVEELFEATFVYHVLASSYNYVYHEKKGQ